MIRRSIMMLTVFFLAAGAAQAGTAAGRKGVLNDPAAVKLMKKMDDLWRGDSSYTVMSMHVKTKHYERTMKMEGW